MVIRKKLTHVKPCRTETKQLTFFTTCAIIKNIRLSVLYCLLYKERVKTNANNAEKNQT